MHLRLNDENNQERLVRTDVALSGSVVYITLSYEERGYPIMIENASDYLFDISQAVRSTGPYLRDFASKSSKICNIADAH